MSKVGDVAPKATFERSDGTRGSFADYLGKPLVVYFYPKDDTPGCTTEAKDFSALAADFAAAGVAVVGVSKDTTASHAKFAKKHALSIELVSDTDGSLCDAFGVWVEKSMYGKTYMGIERATFLIGADGRIAEVWHKVKVKGHAESVLAAARAL
jgi:peroxiredoxin Q/BCP